MAGQVISRLTSSGGTDAGVHVISSSFYGTCSTAADTSAKEIIIQNRNIDQQINLTKGMLLVVKFDYGNTNADSLPTFQLFKNDAASSTSMPIKGTNLSSILPVFAQARTNIKPSWNPGSVVPFIYDTYTYTDPDTGAAVTSGCWIKAAGISDEIIFGIKDDEGQVITTGLVDRVETIQSDVYTSQVVADIEYIYWPIDSETPPPQTPESTSQYQWTTDTLSYDPSLDIWARTKSFTIGNTSNPTYSNPICISGRDGAKGDTGAAALTYALVADVTSLTRDVNTTIPVNNPSTITFSATKTEGNGAPLPYLEGQLTVKQYIYDTNESDWVWKPLTTQSFSPNTPSITVTPSNKATAVRGTLFASDETTQLDTQTIPIIENGESAVVAYLTNESCSFAATSSAAITASASSQFIVNQGGQPLSVTINSITPDITSTSAVNDQVLTVTSSGNNFTVNITDGFTTTNANYPHNGSFKIAATASVNGTSQTFTKDFSWVLVPAGVDGKNGINGANGFNIADIKLYKIGDSNGVSKPKGDLTYTFNTQELTPAENLDGWSVNMPNMTQVTPGWSCYLISANAASLEATDVIKGIGYDDSAEDNSDWYGPVVFVQNGTNGIDAYNHATVSLYQRSLTEPTEPSGSINYTFSTGTLTPTSALGNWTTGVTAAVDGEPCWVISANAVSQGEIYEITDWSNPVIFTRDGAAGSSPSLYELQCNPSVITVDQNVATPTFSPTEIILSATKTEGNNTPTAYAGNFTLEWTSDNNTWNLITPKENTNNEFDISGITVSTATAFRATLYKADGTTSILDTETIPVIRGGKNGINGYNQSTVYLYKRFGSNEQLTKPSNSHIYNFTNKTFTDTDAIDNDKIEGWTINKIPAADGDKIAWMIFAVASSTTPTDEILATEWSDPIKVEGINGADGFNHATIQLYKRYRFPENENDKPAIPAANAVTYTFNPPSLTENVQGALNGWTQTPPEVDGNPCWITVGIAHSQSNSDPIDNWSDPVIYTKDGADGYNKAIVYLYKRAASEPTGNTAKPSAQLTYTFENQTLTSTADLNDWSQTIPTNSTAPLWMIAAVANSTAATDPIETSDWSQPVKMEGIDGQPGTPGTDGYNQATIDLYKRADSAPTSSMPGTLTYTFGATNPLSAPQNNWSQTIPATNGQPCWVTSGTAVSRNASATISNWSTPTKMLEDSINVVIDNDNVTFPTTNGAAAKTTVTCNIKAFKGLTQVPCTIGTISGAPTTGMIISKTNGTATTPAKITIAVSESTSSLLTIEQGTLTIPVTVSGVTNSINKQFTWSLAKNGLNQVTLYLYKRANSATKPTSGNDSVYNFTDKTLTNIPSGWSTAFPKETQGSTTPVWVMTAVASSNTDTDNIAYTEWSTPVRYVSSGSNGKDAFNEAKVFLYRRSTETPVAPTFNEPFNYTFSTGLTADSYNTNTSPAVTWYTDPALATVTSGAATSNNPRNDYMPCWISINHPISQSASATITSNWSTPTIFAQPGKGIIKVTEYYLATNNTTNVTIETTGWVTPNNEVTPPITIPQLNSNAIYLWNYEATEYTDGVIRIIAPHIIAMYDANKGTFSSITNYYQKTKTATTVPEKNDNDWSTSMLQVDNEWKYLWNYKKITYASGDPEYTDVHLIGIYGDNGIGIEDIIEQQILWPYDDSNLTEHPGPGNDANWQSKGDVIWEPGKYIWSQTKVIWTDGKIDYIGRTVAKDINDLNEKMRLTNSGSGTIITSNDAASLPPLSLIIHGKSVQDGTPTPSAPVPIRSVEGWNLWGGIAMRDVILAKVLQSTSGTNEYGDYVTAGAAQLSGVALFSGPFKENTRYTFILSIGKDNASKATNVQINYTDGTYTRKDRTSTASDASPETYILTSVAGKTVANLGGQNFSGTTYFYYENCGVFEGVLTADQFEPYGIISIASHGKNLFDAALSTPKRYINKSNGTVGTSNGWSASDYMRVQDGASYVLSGVENGWSGVAGAVWYDANGAYLSGEASTANPITAPSDAAYVRISVMTEDPSVVQFERGTTATDYEPYQGTATPIDLQGNALRSLPDGTEDTLAVVDGNKTLTKRMDSITLDGSETWTLNSTTANNIRMATTVSDLVNVTNADTVKHVMSSMLRSETASTAVGSDNANVIAAISNNRLFVSVPIAEYPNVAAWTAKLASTPMTVIYELAEPQTIDLGKIDLPSLPSPSFSMHVDAAVTPTLDAEWWTTLGYETGKQHTTANSLLASLSNEITKTQEVLTDNAVIETNQWWFITDKKEKPDKPNEQLVNNTGDYDNWVTKVSDSYIILNPNETDNRYEITKDTSNNYIVKDKIIRDTADQNRDVTEFCIVKKQDNNDEYIYKYYPYNYYCYEYKFLNGEITYSEVIYDSVKSSIAENKIAEEYQQKALEKLLNDQTQVFYSDNNGAHVKDTTGSNYVTTWNTSGIIFSQGDAKLLDILAISGENGKYSGMNIYNGKTGTDEQKIAQFIPNLIQLGSDEEDRVRITREKIEFIKENKSAAEIGNDGFYTPNITVDSKLSLKTPTGSINSENQNETYEWAWIPRSNGNIAFKWIGTPDPNL